MKSIWKIIPQIVFLCLILNLVGFIPMAHAISVGKEREMGKEFLEEVKKQLPLVEDPMALSLVREIGNRIVAQLPPQPFDFHFFIVDSNEFNAFAAPGSNIFINRGLITGLDTVDELAGIIGHEIAHASCRHVSQMIDKAKIANLGTLAGIIAGALLGVGGGGDAAQAVIVGSVAAGSTAMLAYSRENESEADQKGLVYIDSASFSPQGLLTGLEKIRSSDYYGAELIPEYLKTHPGTTDRIVSISSWIDSHHHPSDQGNGIDPFRFDKIKYRLAGQYGREDATEAMFLKQLADDPDNPALHYGFSFLLERKSRLSEALGHLRQALQKKAFDPMILVAIGRIYLLKGEYQSAYDILAALKETRGIDGPLQYYRGVAALEIGNTVDAETDLLYASAAVPDAYPKVWYDLARLYGEIDREGLSHFYLGLYYHQKGDLDTAKFHMEKSLKTLADEEKREKAESVLAEKKPPSSDDD